MWASFSAGVIKPQRKNAKRGPRVGPFYYD